MGKRSKIDTLPPEVRRWLEQALIGNNFSAYQELENLAREKGYIISKSAIHRYGKQMERRMAAIKASTEAARMITEGAADDRDDRSEAVIAMVQTELFEAILNLQEANDAADPSERIAILSAAAKNIATLARASVNQKKFRHEVEEKVKKALIESQREKLSALEKSGEVSADVLAKIIKAAYDL